MRELFDITDTSVLLLRAMRDNIEHYDERLDKILDWWSENGDGQGIYDVMLIESEYIRKHGLPPHRMRQYDYNKKVFYFQGEELPLQPIEEELARIGMWAIGRK